MSTINGFGTLYYDWHPNNDGSANATKWFVVFFLPVLPLRRERLRVLATEPKKSGVFETLLALTGNATGFETCIEVLGTVPSPVGRILKTYLLAYLCVPMIAFMLPVLLFVGVVLAIEPLGFDVNRSMTIAFPVFGILLCAWVGIFVASILDRAAGRKHAVHRQPDIQPFYRSNDSLF